MTCCVPSFIYLVEIEILTNERAANKHPLIMEKKRAEYKIRREKIALNLPSEDARSQCVFQRP